MAARVTLSFTLESGGGAGLVGIGSVDSLVSETVVFATGPAAGGACAAAVIKAGGWIFVAGAGAGLIATKFDTGGAEVAAPSAVARSSAVVIEAAEALVSTARFSGKRGCGDSGSAALLATVCFVMIMFRTGVRAGLCTRAFAGAAACVTAPVCSSEAAGGLVVAA